VTCKPSLLYITDKTIQCRYRALSQCGGAPHSRGQCNFSLTVSLAGCHLTSDVKNFEALAPSHKLILSSGVSATVMSMLSLTVSRVYSDEFADIGPCLGRETSVSEKAKPDHHPSPSDVYVEVEDSHQYNHPQREAIFAALGED
jgi:hypothetical protein